MTLILVGQYAAALLAVLSLFGVFIKWAIVKPIKAYIDHATYPIQPNSNGGRSLPDLIDTVEEIKFMVYKHLQDHKS